MFVAPSSCAIIAHEVAGVKEKIRPWEDSALLAQPPTSRHARPFGSPLPAEPPATEVTQYEQDDNDDDDDLEESVHGGYHLLSGRGQPSVAARRL